jgi:hypothetical protein
MSIRFDLKTGCDKPQAALVYSGSTTDHGGELTGAPALEGVLTMGYSERRGDGVGRATLSSGQQWWSSMRQ